MAVVAVAAPVRACVRPSFTHPCGGVTDIAELVRLVRLDRLVGRLGLHRATRCIVYGVYDRFGRFAWVWRTREAL